MFKRKREEIKLESLLTQLEFFNALQNRHELWLSDIDDPEIAELHHQIIDLVVRLRDQYNRLLNLYQKHRKE